MQRRVILVGGFVGILLMINLGATVPCSAQVDAPIEAVAFMTEHCNDCHSGDTAQGGFAVESLGRDLSDAATFARWERIHDRVDAGEMPPPDSVTATDEQRDRFTASLSARLTNVHAAIKGTRLRRLNRQEYENTMNDLFGTRLALAIRLPEDGRSHEFDNVADALGISMVHLRQYLDAADAVMDAATSKTVDPPAVRTITASYAQTDEGKKFIGSVWKQLPDGAVVFFTNSGYPSGMLRGTEVRPPGRYNVRVTGYAHQSDTPITFRIGGTSFLRGSEKLTYGYAQLRPGDPMTVEMEIDIPERYMIEIDPWGIDLGDYNLRSRGVADYRGPGIAIKQVELTGPIVDGFPSRGHRLIYQDFERKLIGTPKRQREPTFEATSAQPVQAARETLLRVASLAFRRPVSDQDVATYLDLYQSQVDGGASIDQALRTALVAVFCSPQFLFFQEREGGLDDHAIATRLAYFLTRSTPDHGLRSAADEGNLANDPDQLLAHARRLLNDPNHDRFINDFCDAWLNLRDIDFTSPDRQLFPEFDSYLQYSMLKETRGFVRKLIDDNLPIRNLVQSDFVMLNDRLAKHYGFSGVDGPQLRAVTIDPSSVRGGLISQGSVLKVSANGTNTSPVVRGVWVMERLLGDPPQPPPPGVPGIEPDVRGAATLRELLERHRDLENCRVCHQKIDPPGFALECFDPIGGFRTRFRTLGDGDRADAEIDGRKVRYKWGQTVDDSGELPDGTEFAGYLEYRDHLARQDRELATAFVTKLLTFATGREMGFSDRPVIRDIVQQAQPNGYPVRDLIEGVVTSQIFRSK